MPSSRRSCFHAPHAVVAWWIVVVTLAQYCHAFQSVTPDELRFQHDPFPASTTKLMAQGGGTASGKKKKNSNVVQNQQKNRPTKSKKKRAELDGILADIGLQPVRANAKPATRTNSRTASSSSPQPTSKRTSLVQPASTISLKSQLEYARNGHTVLRQFVDPVALQTIRTEVLHLAAEEELNAWRQKVQVASNSAELAQSCRTIDECQTELKTLGITASLPFLQYFNTWRTLSSVHELALSLGEAASILLDVPSVRLYQDSVFWKRTCDGPTPWHVDARMAPFDTSHLLTFWIPLQDVPKDGTALFFCSKTHSDFALPYWNPYSVKKDDGDDHESSSSSSPSEWDRLEDRYPKDPVHYMPMEVSDVTIHSGWTLHCADGNNNNNNTKFTTNANGHADRVALAISFVDANAEIRPDALRHHDNDNGSGGGSGDNEDRWSYQDWARSVPARQQIQHDLVPIVWP